LRKSGFRFVFFIGVILTLYSASRFERGLLPKLRFAAGFRLTTSSTAPLKEESDMNANAIDAPQADAWPIALTAPIPGSAAPAAPIISNPRRRS
jgi:hypothetical protein